LEEVQTSRDLAVIAFGKQDITSFRRRVDHDMRNASAEDGRERFRQKNEGQKNREGEKKIGEKKMEEAGKR
jgi:hypothetical protein